MYVVSLFFPQLVVVFVYFIRIKLIKSAKKKFRRDWILLYWNFCVLRIDLSLGAALLIIKLTHQSRHSSLVPVGEKKHNNLINE